MNKRFWVVILTIIIVMFQVFALEKAIENPPKNLVGIVTNPNYDPSKPKTEKNWDAYKEYDIDMAKFEAIYKKYFLLMGVTLVGGIALAFTIKQEDKRA